MTDAGFGRDIGRDDDALRWALATADVVSAPGDWAATPVPGQRAVSIAPGQGQAAQITMPEIAGAKTDAQVVPLAAPAVMTHAGRLICRELLWYGIEQSPPGESRFVVIDAGDFSAYPSALPDWRSLVSIDPATGFARLPGQRYLMPLHYAVVGQDSNEVRLWSLLKVSPNALTDQWVRLSLQAPFRGVGDSVPQTRRSADATECRGRITTTSGSVGSGGTLTADLGVKLDRPHFQELMTSVPGLRCRVEVREDGTVWTSGLDTANPRPAWVSLDTLRIPI